MSARTVPAASGVYCMTEAEARQYMEQELVVDTFRPQPLITRSTGEPEHSDQGNTAGWSHRQQAAMRRLLWLWHHSLPERVQPAGYPSQVCQPYTPKGEECHSPQEVETARQAYLAYREALDLVEGRCSHRHASVLRMAVRGEPSRVGVESLVREALTVLAGAWRVR
ncbi:hypothetical protein [Roseomonas gilardii]|nr:hypothetical protein [Roseomonas gilardii]SUE43891.1 Uncharacterised protein [Roseomonas gilardii subsp. rosea]